MKDLSDELRDLVKKSGVTRYQIWKATGVSQVQLMRFVNGRAEKDGSRTKVWLSEQSFNRLAEYLGLRLIRSSKKPRQRKAGK
jgi:transcriptional regulator with XRE-family HTH domain